MNSKTLNSGLAASLLMLTACSLQAGLVVPLSIEQLARQSEIVMRGTVLGHACMRDPAGRIYTKVELQVAEVWKGRAMTNRFTVVHAGGTLGETHAPAPENEEYQLGEEVVVFAVLNRRGEEVALGLGQGKFTVSKDGDEKFARSRFHGAPATSENHRSKENNVTRGRLSLKELKRRVATSIP